MHDKGDQGCIKSLRVHSHLGSVFVLSREAFTAREKKGGSCFTNLVVCTVAQVSVFVQFRDKVSVMMHVS